MVVCMGSNLSDTYDYAFGFLIADFSYFVIYLFIFQVASDLQFLDMV